jgi:hypothetical protein
MTVSLREEMLNLIHIIFLGIKRAIKINEVDLYNSGYKT